MLLLPKCPQEEFKQNNSLSHKKKTAQNFTTKLLARHRRETAQKQIENSADGRYIAERTA